MDENDDFLKPTYKGLPNRESFSSKSSHLRDKNLRVGYKQGDQNTATRIAYGKEAILVIDRFVNTCQREMNIVTDKNGM